MSRQELKPGDRVRVTERCPMHAYRAGGKGIIRSRPQRSSDGTKRCYHAAMDKGGPVHKTILFTAAEIEPDV